MSGGKISIEKDPCSLESNASMKCLDTNNYDRSMCQQYFDNYIACKKFWGKVSLARSRSGISPSVPPVHERDALKRLYMETGKIHATAPPAAAGGGGGGASPTGPASWHTYRTLLLPTRCMCVNVVNIRWKKKQSVDAKKIV